MRRNIAFIFASFVMSLSLVMAALPVPAVADAGHGQKDMKQAKIFSILISCCPAFAKPDLFYYLLYI